MLTEYVIYFFLIVLSIFPMIKRLQRDEKLFSRKDTTIIRGISAIFVIVAHYQGWVDNALGIEISSAIKFSFGQLGGIGVLLFFFASGYGIHESYGTRKVDHVYLIKRLVTVYLPYIIIKLVLLPERYIFGVTNASVLVELKDIFLISDWFIFVIVLQYLVYYFAAAFFRKHLILVSIAADIVFSIAFIVLDKPIGWFNALWLFTFGIVVSQYQTLVSGIIDRKIWLSVGVMLICFVITGLLFAANKGAAWANVVKPSSGIFLCLFFAAIFRIISIESALAKWAGPRSMHLYVVHITVWDCMAIIVNPIIRLLVSLLLTSVITELLFRTTGAISKTIKEKLMV